MRLLRIDSGQPADRDDTVILAAIESAVDRTDPRIRMVGGYQRKLRAAVTHALAYANEIVAKVPGPVQVNGRTFGSDPCVHAFFISVEQLQRIFSLSREVRKFFAAPENRERTECYGLLVMEKRERTILGAELKGGIVQRDVAQVTVSFSEHRILAAAGTDAECRASLKHRVFKDLLACAVEDILRAQIRRRGLEDQQQRIKLRLRMLESRTQGLEDSLETMEIRDEEDIEALREQLAGLEQALRGQEFKKVTASFTALEDYLAQLNRVLDHPEDYFRLREETLRLNRIGIKMSAAPSQVSEEIPFAAVELGRHLRCVAILVNYSRRDMLPIDHYLEKALLT
jgi:hypothetical protein